MQRQIATRTTDDRECWLALALLTVQSDLQRSSIGVFLVEDHRTVLWGLEQLVLSARPRLQLAGTAGDPDALFAGLRSTRPDLILLDLDLGGYRGVDCLQRIGQVSAAQVLVLTGSEDTGLHQEAVVRGARGVIRKLEPAADLLRAIEAVHAGQIWLDPSSLGQVLSTLSKTTQSNPVADKWSSLTAKESAIVSVLVREQGARNKALAAKLHISEHTLRNHFTTIYQKLGVGGRMALYAQAATRTEFQILQPKPPRGARQP